MPHKPESKSGSVSPKLIGGVVILIVLALFAVIRLTSAPKLESLPVEGYLDSPGDFLGNRYSLKAQINSQIKWEKGLGRILAVRPEGAKSRLPVFVPDESGRNLHVGQRFDLQVLIEEGGLIYVEALRKY